jgi:gamma-glutamyltranspeptidase/glutathione hydrolase
MMSAKRLAAASFCLLAATLDAQGSALPPYGRGLPVPGRSVITTKLGIVATSQPLASSAGVQILERGGNAIDAAIAANATLGLTEPMMNGIGGDLFAIIYEAKTGKLYGLNASGWAATGMTADFVATRAINGKMPQRGVMTVNVPGAVAGWGAMQKKFGKLGFDQTLAPAIYYAEHGFPVGEITAGLWAPVMTANYTNDAFKATFLPGARSPRAGEVFKNPDLAASLKRIAAKGTDGFYRGATADAILATIKDAGGTMTAADLTEFSPEWVTPLSTKYRDWTVYELPPNGQGLAALEMLNIMSRYPIAEYGWASAKAMHVEIEAKKLAYADLLKYIGDPRFSKLPVQQLLSSEHAAARAKLIDASKANCHVAPAQLAGVESGASETIYLSVIDQEGNIVSFIQSNYSAFGSGLVAKGTGFPLHNRGGLFTLEKNSPNTIMPRKRPLHTIIPAFMEKGDTKIGFGIMGGWNQSQAHAQFVSDIADFGMNIQQALEASRFTKPTFDGCDVLVEPSLPSAVVAELKALGHVPQVMTARVGSEFGFGQAVMSKKDGVHFGASDSRHDGQAIPQGAPAFGGTKPAKP